MNYQVSIDSKTFWSSEFCRSY